MAAFMSVLMAFSIAVAFAVPVLMLVVFALAVAFSQPKLISAAVLYSVRFLVHVLYPLSIFGVGEGGHHVEGRRHGHDHYRRHGRQGFDIGLQP